MVELEDKKKEIENSIKQSSGDYVNDVKGQIEPSHWHLFFLYFINRGCLCSVVVKPKGAEKPLQSIICNHA